MDTLNEQVSKFLSFLDNEYISAALSLFLVLYAGLAAPKLPNYVATLFDNLWFKLVIFFLIAYTARKNPTTAIIAAIGLMISLQTLARYKVNNQIVNVVSQVPDGAPQVPTGPITAAEAPGGAENIPQEALAELNGAGSGCRKKAAFRNSFYPQYVNMDPYAYMARYTGNDIAGHDNDASYALV